MHPVSETWTYEFDVRIFAECLIMFVRLMNRVKDENKYKNMIMRTIYEKQLQGAFFTMCTDRFKVTS